MWDTIKSIFSGRLGYLPVIFPSLLVGTLMHMLYYDVRSPAYYFGRCIANATVLGGYATPDIQPEPLLNAIIFSAVPIALFIVTIILAVIQSFKSGIVLKTVSVIFLIASVFQIIPLASSINYDVGKLSHYSENIDQYLPKEKRC